MPTFKQFAFFEHAAAHLPAVPFVGKVDDDTLVNLPALLPVLAGVRCLRLAFLGAINWAAYVPRATWSGVRGDRCARLYYYPPILLLLLLLLYYDTRCHAPRGLGCAATGAPQ